MSSTGDDGVLAGASELDRLGAVSVADLGIAGVRVSSDEVTVILDLDGDHRLTVDFQRVWAWCGFSPFGETLSHIDVGTDGALLALVRGTASWVEEDPPEPVREARFVSAWTDEPVLIVVAADVRVAEG